LTLSEAQTLLAAAQSAYSDALSAHASGIGDRQLTRQRITDLRAEITHWTRIVNDLTAAAAGSNRIGIKLPRWSA
jgi:hypothetical protein